MFFERLFMGKTRMGQKSQFYCFDRILAVMIVLATMLGEGHGNYGMFNGAPPSGHHQSSAQGHHLPSGGHAQGVPVGSQNGNTFGHLNAPPPGHHQSSGQGGHLPGQEHLASNQQSQSNGQWQTPPNQAGYPGGVGQGPPMQEPEPDPLVIPGEYRTNNYGKRYYFKYETDLPGDYYKDEQLQKWIYRPYPTPKTPGQYKKDPVDGVWKFIGLDGYIVPMNPASVSDSGGSNSANNPPPPPPPSPVKEVMQPVNQPSSNDVEDSGEATREELTESDQEIVEVAVGELSEQLVEGVVGALEEDEALAMEEENIKNAQGKSSQRVVSNLIMITLVLSVVKLC